MTRTQKKSKLTRQRLQKAALDVFTEKGVESATIEEITDKADLGKGTLYRYFADKEEIVISLVEQAVENLIAKFHSFDTEPDSLEDVLERLLNAHYEFFTDNSRQFILLFQGRVLLKLQSDTADGLEEPYLRYLEEIENQISPYISPRIDPAKVRRLACAVAGFVFGFFSFAMIGMDSEELETSIRPLRRVFVNSLCTFIGR